MVCVVCVMAMMAVMAVMGEEEGEGEGAGERGDQRVLTVDDSDLSQTLYQSIKSDRNLTLVLL